MLATEVTRAENYLHAGAPLVDLLPDDLRLDVALFAAGGLAIARKIRELDFNVWAARPTLSKAAKLNLLVQCWWRTRRTPEPNQGREKPL